MSDLTLQEVYDLFCDIIDIPIGNEIGRFIVILCLRALQCEKLYRNEDRRHENRMWCYLHSYYGERNREIIPSFYKNNIKRIEFINRLIKIDEILTEYNCKDDEENKERNEFLFLYHQLINKYMV